MNIEGSSISCGVRRLTIGNKDQPTKEQLNKLLETNKSCAMIVAAVPTRRRDVITLLLDNKFEQVKNPNVAEKQREEYRDKSLNNGFDDMAFLIMHHDHEQELIDDTVLLEQFTDSTVDNKLGDLASLVMHHGNELIGNLSLFIHYTNSK